MYIVKKNPSVSGAYGVLKTWSKNSAPEGYALWPDSVDIEDFINNKGFVNLVINDNNVVVSYSANTEAKEAWERDHTEPTPDKPEDYVTYDQMADMIKEGVNNVE